MVRRLIPQANSNFLKAQIESGTPQQAKRALQELCGLYRSGHRVAVSNDLQALENAINGVIFTRTDDEKIRRWALNAIAQLGRPQFSVQAVYHALNNYQNEPQTVAAAIAALFAIDCEAQSILRKRYEFPNDVIVLAALQRSEIADVDIANTRINIETASPDILKLALIVVGVDNAPEHIFHPRHRNEEIVRVLGAHDDDLISQYSIWAVTENDALNISHLGVDLKDIESQWSSPGLMDTL